MRAALARDLASLRWWREVFAARFGPDGLPCEDQALYAYRLVLCVRIPDGSLVEWADLDVSHRHARTAPPDPGRAARSV